MIQMLSVTPVGLLSGIPMVVLRQLNNDPAGAAVGVGWFRIRGSWMWLSVGVNVGVSVTVMVGVTVLVAVKVTVGVAVAVAVAVMVGVIKSGKSGGTGVRVASAEGVPVQSTGGKVIVGVSVAAVREIVSRKLTIHLWASLSGLDQGCYWQLLLAGRAHPG